MQPSEKPNSNFDLNRQPRSGSVQRVRLLCPGMYHEGGHEIGYTKHLARAFSGLGLQVIVVHPMQIQVDFCVAQQPMSIPKLGKTANARGIFRPLRSIQRWRRKRAIRQILEQGRSQDLNVFHTLDFADLNLILEMTELVRGHLFIVLRYDHYDDPKQMEILQRLSVHPEIILATDSENLSRLFDSLLEKRVPVLPPPIEGPTKNGHSDNGLSTPLSISFFGGARPSKGFCRLPKIIRTIAEERPKTQFYIQAYSHRDDMEHSTVSQAICEIAGIPGVELERNITSSETYNAQMQDTDIVLVPYDRKTYRAVSSGVFVEAVAHSKSVIVEKGTWMQDEAARNGLSNVISVNFDDRSEIINALRILEPRIYKPCPNSFEWGQNHSYEVLAKQILSITQRSDFEV